MSVVCIVLSSCVLLLHAVEVVVVLHEVAKDSGARGLQEGAAHALLHGGGCLGNNNNNNNNKTSNDNTTTNSIIINNINNIDNRNGGRLGDGGDVGVGIRLVRREGRGYFNVDNVLRISISTLSTYCVVLFQC